MSDESLLPRGAWPWLPFLAVALAPLMMSSGWINIAILTMLFVYLCVAWNIVGGFAGQFCIGHSLFLAAGELLRHELGSGLPGVHLLAYGVLLVVVIRFAPDGLLGALERARQAWQVRRKPKEASPK